MRLSRLFVAVLLAIGLAGCFTADKALLTDANSVAPYSKITFRSLTNSADTITMTRSGKTYLWKSSDGTATVRFMAVDRPNWYVVEIASPPGASGPALLYGVLRVDPVQNTADAFKTVADPMKDIRSGLRACKDNTVCIDDVNAYIAAAKAYADGGGKPDNTYGITLEQ